MSKIEEFFEKAVAAGIIPQIPMNYDAVCYKIYTGYLENKIDELAAENAELRARLECSIEFPCKVGDTIYFINPYKEQPKIDEFKVTSLCKDNSYGKMIYIDNGEFFFAKTDGLFFTRAEAEARLKELKGKMVYTVIKNCTNCQHYDVGWAECTAPATANFDCESTHRTCFTQDIIDDECKKHLCVAKLEFDLKLLDPKTGKLLPYYFTDKEAAEAKRKELKEKNND